MTTRQIFLSHSSTDGMLATLLAHEIEKELGDDFRVFASTRADAINSGDKWFDVIRERMDNADALVVLITESAKNSAWVGFELGYFWHKDNIHPLHHPRVPLPAPFSVLQSKKITVREELDNFFNALCEKLGVKRSNEADLDAIIKTAHETVIMPIGDKSLGKFVEYLENSSWAVANFEPILRQGDELLKISFVCQENTDYEISVDRLYNERFSKYKDIKLHIMFVLKLKINDKEFRKLEFIGSWMAETLIPAPEFRRGVASEYFWSKNSLSMKIARLISIFDNFKPQTPEEFDEELKKLADKMDIQIVE